MNASSRSEKSLRERFREATREAILRAAETTFAEQGLQSARMEDIAAGAGIAVGTVYNYFADRQALLVELLEARRHELMARVDHALDSSPSFASKLELFVVQVLEHFEEHRALFSVLVEEEISCQRNVAKSKPVLRELSLRAEQIIKAGLDEHLLREEDASLFPAFLVGMIRGMIFSQINRKSGEPLRRLVEPIVRFFQHGAALKS